MRLFRKRTTNRGREVATAVRKQPIAGAQARSSQNRLRLYSSALGPEVPRTGERFGVPVWIGGAFKTARKQIMPAAPGLGR